ncbi:MAG: HAD family phosphatase [Rikenellaceae bacterium]
MREIKGVLFDMDGVLVDNMHMHIEAFKQFCEQFGVEDIEQKMYECAGMGNDEIMRIMLPAEVVESRGTDSLSAEKEAKYREIYADSIEPVKGLVEMLKLLNERGIKCAVGSSGCRENVEFVLNSCGIAHYFSALVYSDLVTRCKPDPEIYLTAASLLGLKPEECLVFEDALMGIESARAAKVAKVVGLTTTIDRQMLEDSGGCDYIVDDFTQIIEEFR